MRLATACEAVYARHETFHPRYGWVKKAYDTAAKDPNIFRQDDAVVELGVGKNMVRSIRHWGLAFRVLARGTTGRANQKSSAMPSAIGRTMFSDEGWDPYCELPSTLWLLHWWLFAPPSIMPVWWLAFNEFTAIEFTAEQLEQFVMERTRDSGIPHVSAVKKDVSCMLRMYVSGHVTRATFDDAIDCPFRSLSLIRSSEAVKGAYRFLLGVKPTLPPAIAAFACLDFLARNESTAQTITVSRLATEAGAPGRIFKLPETALSVLLEQAAAEYSAIEVTSSTGVPQLAFEGDVADVASSLLRDHYEQLTGNTRQLPSLCIAGSAGDCAVSFADRGSVR